MIRLSKLLNENIENRVSLAKVQILMEKVLDGLKNSEVKEIKEKCQSVHQLAEVLNNTPYTIHGVEKWNVLKATMMAALLEIRHELSELKDVDTTALIKALDEVIVS